MSASSTDVAFTPSVKDIQTRRGSRDAYARLEEKGGFATAIDDSLAAFIANIRSFYFATANRECQPYIQHRGGPKGFLRVLDPRTLAFADFAGNRQYISVGNLADNSRAMLFLMDYTVAGGCRSGAPRAWSGPARSCPRGSVPGPTAPEPSKPSCSR